MRYLGAGGDYFTSISFLLGFWCICGFARWKLWRVCSRLHCWFECFTHCYLTHSFTVLAHVNWWMNPCSTLNQHQMAPTFCEWEWSINLLELSCSFYNSLMWVKCYRDKALINVRHTGSVCLSGHWSVLCIFHDRLSCLSWFIYLFIRDFKPLWTFANGFCTNYLIKSKSFWNNLQELFNWTSVWVPFFFFLSWHEGDTDLAPTGHMT